MEHIQDAPASARYLMGLLHGADPSPLAQRFRATGSPMRLWIAMAVLDRLGFESCVGEARFLIPNDDHYADAPCLTVEDCVFGCQGNEGRLHVFVDRGYNMTKRLVSGMEQGWEFEKSIKRAPWDAEANPKTKDLVGELTAHLQACYLTQGTPHSIHPATRRSL